ncbi:MAG: FGGY-family carbohydrate kinase [Deltaproteobacteria bacterium]|nr:FGGY-family carbohydrate kinase [Deltaproteobacteria bacterium]
MNDDCAILGIDLGTSGAKVGIVTLAGDCLDWTLEKVPLLLVGTGGAEQNPDDWWRAINIAVKRLVSRETIPANRILAVCTSSMGEETVPVDRNGNCLMNAMNWMDQRGAAAIREQLKGWINPAGMGYGLANILKWIRYTGGVPSPSGKDPAGHITYIRKELPEIYEKTHKFLNSLDFVNLRLTGEYVATYDSILPLWVTDNRDLARIRYHSGLLKALDLDRDKLPELVPPTAVIGKLLPRVAESWGLSPDVKVVAGSVDSVAAPIGGGAVRDFDPCLTLGTSSFITAHVPFKKTDIAGRMASFPSAVDGKYVLLNNQTTAGGNLSFIADNVVYHKDALLQEEKKPDLYKVFDKVCREVPPGSNGLFYSPWIFGERSPMDDHFIRGGIHNISLHNNREDIVRAVFEGVAFNAKWLLESVIKFLKSPCDTIRMTGGGAASDVWCQIHADILDRKILQVVDPIRSNARGAGLIGAVGIGEISMDAVPDLVKIRNVYEPNAAHRRLYDERFDIFKEFYRKTRRLYERLNGSRQTGSAGCP